MESILKRKYLTKRLNAALELLALDDVTFDTVADIGCDHGKISIEILLSGIANQVYASDISVASLAKAKSLAVKYSLESKLHCILSDGFASYKKDELQAAVLCGMGGELISHILETRSEIACSLKRIVMQPMRGETELRRYLYTHNYRIIAERVIWDNGRYYQLLCAEPGIPSPLPNGWPENYYQFGAVAFEANEPLLQPMLLRYINIIEHKLHDASSARPQALIFEVDSAKRILELINERNKS